MNAPSDQAQRHRALDPLGSFICEAPAGSGKTELLTQRVLTLLARVEQPESILSITFTRKAAAEMRERILKALSAALGPKPREIHAQTTWLLAKEALNKDRQGNWSILENPNRLQIRTFDSLCATLTQTLPLHSQLGSGVRVSDEPQVLYAEAVTDFLKSIDGNTDWSVDLVNLFRHLDNRYSRVEELLLSLLKTRDAWLPMIRVGTDFTELRSLLEGYLASVIDDKKFALMDSVSADLFAELATMADFAAANITREGKSSNISHLEGLHQQQSNLGLSSVQCQGLGELLLTGTGQWRKKLDKNCGFPPGSNTEEKKACKSAKEKMMQLIARLSKSKALHDSLLGIKYWPEPNYSDAQWDILQSLTRLLPVLVAHLQLVFRKYAQVDFLEMSFRAQQALGSEEEPTDLAMRLDHKIQHLLADEFQDTSHNQLHLLKQLTLGWEPGDGRTLFCVGDAMQSIYGFRSADVGLFLNCKQRGLGNIDLEVLRLNTNFRSQAGVVDWVNRAFAQAFPEQSDVSSGAVSYSPAEAFLSELNINAAQAILYDSDDTAIEGELVAEIVLKARQRDPFCTIAILVRGKRHAELSAAALKSAGIRFRAVDLEPLSSSSVIQDLLCLTKALLYPSDRIACLAVLRAPWCGLSLADLQVLAAHGDTPASAMVFDQISCVLQTTGALSGQGLLRLERCGRILLKALQERQRKPLRLWLEGVWLELGGASCLRSDAESENAQRFFQCLEGLNKDGSLPDSDQLEEAVKGLFSASDPEADDSLQIMTMHKSKGLEFDHVILPSLHKASGKSDSPLLLWQERVSRKGQEQWLLAPITEYGQEKDSVYRHLQYEQSLKEQYEACRLLYVACTRAKQQLHLLCGVRGLEGGRDAIRAPSGRSLMASIWPTVINDIHTRVVESSPAIEIVMESNASVLRRLPAEWRLPELPKTGILSQFVLPANYDNRSLPKDLLMSPKVDSARLAGTLIHELLQSVGSKGLDWWRGQDLLKLKPVWLARLKTMGLSGVGLTMAGERVSNAMQKVVCSAYMEWILKERCEFECAFSGINNGQVEHHIIDVLRYEGKSQVTIIDYKTSSPRDGEPEEFFMQRERREYNPQMARYRNLLQDMGYKEVKSLLFFVMIDAYLECV